MQGAINGIHKFDKWGDYDEHALIDTMDLGHIRAQACEELPETCLEEEGYHLQASTNSIVQISATIIVGSVLGSLISTIQLRQH